MSHIKSILLAIAFVALTLFSCKKDLGSKNTELYIVSAGKIIDIAGKNWDNVMPQLSDKKDYWYTGFTQDQNFGVKAAISLPAIDDSNRTIHCSLILNVRRQDNQVTSVVMNAPDTTSKLNLQEAYAIMLNYHNQTAKLLTQITLTSAYYETIDGLNVKTTVSDILSKLANGFVAKTIAISYNATQGGISLVVFKNGAGNEYSFRFSDFRQ